MDLGSASIFSKNSLSVMILGHSRFNSIWYRFLSSKEITMADRSAKRFKSRVIAFRGFFTDLYEPDVILISLSNSIRSSRNNIYSISSCRSAMTRFRVLKRRVKRSWARFRYNSFEICPRITLASRLLWRAIPFRVRVKTRHLFYWQ